MNNNICKIDECTSPVMAKGMCRMHYKRNYRYGDPHHVERIRKYEDRSCSIAGCSLPVLAKGLCTNHYALKRRNGRPETVKRFVGHYIKDGYKYVIVGYRHYEPEHRVIMEKHLGRKLSSEEQVHHIDGNTLNNQIENLQIVSRSQHMKIHRHALTEPMVRAIRAKPRKRRSK